MGKAWFIKEEGGFHFSLDAKKKDLKEFFKRYRGLSDASCL